jgi:hypothetical protein
VNLAKYFGFPPAVRVASHPVFADARRDLLLREVEDDGAEVRQLMVFHHVAAATATRGV